MRDFGRIWLSSLILAILVTFGYAVSTVIVEDCLPGKYFWQEENPTDFYACLSLPKKAVKMQCGLGTYMCNTGPEVFQPCKCKGDPKTKGTTEKSTEALPEGAKLTTADVRSFYKQGPELPKLDDPEDDSPNDVATLNNRVNDVEPVDSMPSGGCPDDPFKLVKNAHMYRGEAVDGTLMECQEQCLDKSSCLGVDYNRDTKQCYYLDINEKETIRYGLNYHDYIDHYRRTHCYSTLAARDGVTDAMTTPQSTALPFTDTTAVNSRTEAQTVINAVTVTEPATTASPMTTAAPATYTPMADAEVEGAGERGPEEAEGEGYYGEMDNERMDEDMAQPRTDGTSPINVTPSNGVPTTTTTFPDTGCPYTFQKFESTSHPFGRKVTSETTIEGCKLWCLKFAFCKGVDFDTKQDTCYYLREIQQDLVATKFDTVHFRKIECAPPLKCWSEEKYVKRESELSVTDENTAQTACHGLCFVSQSLSKDGTLIQRGCMTVTDPSMADIPNGCSIDSTLMTLVCFCDTARCNGLSIQALSSQLLYLPLDGDFQDKSGIGRDGTAVQGRNTPEFSCLDKVVNCSAIFDGNSCIGVSGLSQVQWGTPDLINSNFIPSFTVAFWYKRATTTESEQVQGVLGNSLDTTAPSWQVIAENMNNFLGAGVSSSSHPALDDYPYILAANDEWHHISMTYSGVENAEEKVFSLLKLYVDGVPQMGNARADKGEIGVRSQAVSVGCVGELRGLIGFLDEIRLFNLVVDMYDIKAMRIMRDSPNYA